MISFAKLRNIASDSHGTAAAARVSVCSWELMLFRHQDTNENSEFLSVCGYSTAPSLRSRSEVLGEAASRRPAKVARGVNPRLFFTFRLAPLLASRFTTPSYPIKAAA